MLTHTTQEIFNEAFGMELMTVWSGTPFTMETSNLSFFRAATAFIEKNQEAVSDRRSLLHTILKRDFKHDSAEDTINKMRSILPSDAGIAKRAIRNLCAAYIKPPERRFGEKGKFNDSFRDFYETAAVDAALDRAYKIAKLTNVALVMPVIRNGELELDVYSADMFRVKTAPGNYRQIDELWLQTVIGDDIAYHVWSSTQYRLVSNKDGRTIEYSDNPYGIIPAVVLKLTHERDFYGGGLWELIEAQLDISKLQFFADQNVTYSGFSVWVAQNFGKENTFVLSPNKVIAVNDITSGEGQFLPPQLDTVSPEPHFLNIDELRDRRERRVLRQLGLPNSLIAENTGTQSGVSRIVEMQELIDIRTEDQNVLRRFERLLCKMIALVVNLNLRKGLPENGDVSVNFSEEQIFTEPEKEYALWKEQWQDGVMSTAEFVRRVTRNETITTDAEAIEYIKKNRDLLSKLKPKELPNENGTNGRNEPDNAGNPPAAPAGAGNTAGNTAGNPASANNGNNNGGGNPAGTAN